MLNYFSRIFFLAIFLFLGILQSQVLICHPPDEVSIKSFGRMAKVEWVFEQPDTVLSYSNGVPGGIYGVPKEMAMGVVFDLENFPGATLEEIDFVHYGNGKMEGDTFYRIYIFDMDSSVITYTIDSLEAVNSFDFPEYEVAVPLGSLPYLKNPGIFIQGLSTPDSSIYFPYPMTDNIPLIPETSYWCMNINDPFDGNLLELNYISPNATNININLWINYDSGGKIELSSEKTYDFSTPINFDFDMFASSATGLLGNFSGYENNLNNVFSQDEKGFYIYRGTIIDSLNLLGTVDYNTREFLDPQPFEGITYYYAVSTYQDSVQSKRLKVEYKQPQIFTIGEAKIDQDGDFIPDLKGEEVTVQGVITTPNFDTKTQYFLQDETGGIFLHSDEFAVELNVGDSILVKGKMAQQEGLSEIEPDSIIAIYILNENNPIDTMNVSFNQINESSEGRLVKFENITIVNPESWPPIGNEGSMVKITDGIDTIGLFIDKDTELDGWTPPQGTINLIGVVDQSCDNIPPNNGYEIRPRYRTDFIQLTSIENSNSVQALSFKLNQNYPNPFNPSTIISYQLPITSDVDLSIYNLLGQKVATLVSEKQDSGIYSLEWNAYGFASGVYFYKLQTTQGFIETKKLILMR